MSQSHSIEGRTTDEVKSSVFCGREATVDEDFELITIQDLMHARTQLTH